MPLHEADTSRKHVLPKLVVLTCLWVLTNPASLVLADFDAALRAYENRDFAEARRQLQPLSDQADPRSQFLIGLMFLKGDGVTKSPNIAAYWFEKSAAAGVAAAQYNMGILYERGEGVERDVSKATYWYRWAAEQEVAKAQYQLGHFYETGTSATPKNLVEALMWFKLAATRGEKKAVRAVARLSQQMTTKQIAHAEKQVKAWPPQPRSKGIDRAWARLEVPSPGGQQDNSESPAQPDEAVQAERTRP